MGVGFLINDKTAWYSDLGQRKKESCGGRQTTRALFTLFTGEFSHRKRAAPLKFLCIFIAARTRRQSCFHGHSVPEVSDHTVIKDDLSASYGSTPLSY